MAFHKSRGAESRPIEKGSVLAIPLADHKWALGQVIYPGTNFYLGVALDKFYAPLRAEDINGKNLRLFSWTNDAEIFRGNWTLLGKFDQIPDLVLPEYRVLFEGELAAESFDGETLRPFDEVLDCNLNFRKVRSPLLVQDAVQAALGYGEWKPAFEEMLEAR